MKRTTFIALVFTFVCLITQYVLNYWVGYYEDSYLPLAFQGLLVTFSFIAFVYVAIIWIISMFWKKQRFWATGILIGFLVLTGLTRIIPPPNQIVYGLRDRLVHDNGLEDLRHFAQDFDQLPRPTGNLSGDTKSFLSNDLAKTDLKKKHSFLSWVKGAVYDGPSYVDETHGVIAVRWGGAVSGHWGFNIAINGGKLDLPTEPDIKAVRLSDDIIVVYEPD